MFSLALRNVFRHKGRTAITVGAITFGVTALILAGGFVNDIFVQLGEALIHSQTGHVQVFKKGYFEQGTRSPEKFLIEDATVYKDRITRIPGVGEVLGRVTFSGVLNNGRADWPILGEGIEPSKEARLGTYMRLTSGRLLDDSDVHGILVGQGVAQALQLKVGNRITLVANTAEGAINTVDLGVVGIFQSFSKDFDERSVRVPLSAAHDLLQGQGINTLVVTLHRTVDTPIVAAILRSRLEGTPLEALDWMQLNDFYAKTVALYERQFGVLQLIVLAMVFLSVANSLNMTIFERLGEFGTMRAIGNRRRDVFRLVLKEASILGLFGSGLGVAVGILCAFVISKIGIPMPPPPNANLGYTAHIQIVPMTAATAFAIGSLAAIIAALFPALRVSRIPLVEALRVNV